MSSSTAIVNGNVKNQENMSSPAGEGPPKTAKQLEKEAKKLAKLEKFKQKQEKQKDVPTQTKEKVEVCLFCLIESCTYGAVKVYNLRVNLVTNYQNIVYDCHDFM
jgi:hypothetical protein